MADAKDKIRDKDIRVELIRRNLEFFKANTFVNELGINSKNIMDVAALDFDKNMFWGFEIKSEADNLKRLQKQLSTYSTFFNVLYVVGHEKHTSHILTLLDNNREYCSKVGYIEVTSDLDFKELRKAKLATPRFDTFIRNLDMEELETICEAHGKYEGWESKNLLVDKLKRQVTMDDIYEHMKSKVERYYVKYCPKCGSNLYYNKRDRNGKKWSFCYECDAKF